MRPQDLKYPFKETKPHALIQDKVWYVPKDITASASCIFPGWDSPLLFKESKPICLEYCSGNGAWIANKAMEQPQFNWVAVEKKFERVRKIWSKIKNFQLTNLLIVYGEGEAWTQQFVPDASVFRVFINFPDPWPKRRHARHRIIQSSFIKEMERVLQPQGELTFVTDDRSYSDWTIDIVLRSQLFDSLYAAPHYVTDYPDYGSSYFEDLWRDRGRFIYYHSFRKKGTDEQTSCR